MCSGRVVHVDDQNREGVRGGFFDPFLVFLQGWHLQDGRGAMQTRSWSFPAGCQQVWRHRPGGEAQQEATSTLQKRCTQN